MKTGKICLAAASVSMMLASSCSTPKGITYFEDLQAGQQLTLPSVKPIKLQPNDKLSIIVSTGDARLNAMFNLPVARKQIGMPNEALIQNGTIDGTAPYTIDSKGDISFPELGTLHVAGMTREQLAEYIRRELMSRDLAKNPIVTVDYLNLSVTVLGDVTNPGRYPISREDYTILDAIGAAGDLAITGKRDNVKVLRDENGVQKVYEVNLNESQDLTKSPVYYLQQNDVVYIQPNATKARMSTPSGNSTLSTGFWISVASLATSVGVLIINVSK